MFEAGMKYLSESCSKTTCPLVSDTTRTPIRPRRTAGTNIRCLILAWSSAIDAPGGGKVTGGVADGVADGVIVGMGIARTDVGENDPLDSADAGDESINNTGAAKRAEIRSNIDLRGDFITIS